MALSLIAGPANAGKVELLLDRYLAALEREPVLIVPNRSDVDRVERELLARRPALLGGSIGTFDDVFERIAWAGGDARPLVSQAQRALLVRRALAGARLNGLSASARFGGFADALLQTVGELESGLLDPGESRRRPRRAARRVPVGARPARALGPRPAAPPRRRAAPVRPRRLARRAGLRVRLRGPDRRRVGAARGARGPHRGERLAPVRAGPAGVRVAPPHRRGSLASRRRHGSRSCRRAPRETAHPAIAHLERALFSDEPPPPVPLDGAIRFFEGAGARGALELVGEELLALLRAGTPPERIGIVCPSVERRRAPLETALGTLGVPYSIDGEVRLAQTPLGHALTALLRFAWLGGTRSDLFTYPPLAVLRARAARGRLRRGPPARARRPDAGARRRGVGEAARRAAAGARGAAGGRRSGRGGARRSPRGCSAARTGSTVRRRPSRRGSTCARYETVTRLLGELERWRGLVGELSRDDVDRRARAADAAARRAATSRVASRSSTCCARARAASTSSSCSGSRRAACRGAARRRRSSTTTPAARSTSAARACSGPTRSAATATSSTRRARGRCERLYLVREAATDEGSPREPSPFWDEVQAVLDPEDVRRWTRRRPLSALTWSLDDAPTERERLRALAELAATDADARRRARARERLGAAARPRAARVRPADADHASARARAARRPLDVQRHRARALRRLLVGVVRRAVPRPALDRRGGRREAARLGRALGALQVLHAAPEGARRREARRARRRRRGAADARVPRRGDPGRAHGDDGDAGARARPDAVARPRGGRLRGGRVGAAARAAPLRGPVRQRARRAGAPARARPRRRHDAVREDRPDRRRPVRRARHRPGLQVGQARALGRARSRASCGSRSRCTCSCSATSSGSSRSAASTGRSRASGRRAGCSARPRRETLPGYAKNDYLDEDAFWARSRTRARPRDGSPGGSATGDVVHDPKGGDCPAWCDLWPMCRVRAHERRTERQQTPSSARGRGDAARSSSRPARARARRPCSSSGSSRAVCDRGLDVDSILVITYTRRAAGELRTRIRHALTERGRPDLARELDGAWISTIHGFCLRLLKAYPFAAGLDPRFRELDDNQGAVLRSEAFQQALAEFCADGEPDRLRLLATYGASRAAADAHRRLRDAPLRRAGAAARHRRPSRAGGARGGAARGGARCSPPIPRRPTRSAATRSSCSRCSSATRVRTG